MPICAFTRNLKHDVSRFEYWFISRSQFNTGTFGSIQFIFGFKTRRDFTSIARCVCVYQRVNSPRLTSPSQLEERATEPVKPMLVTAPTAAVPVSPEIGSSADTLSVQLAKLQLDAEEKGPEMKPAQSPPSPKRKTQLDAICTVKGTRLSNCAVECAAHNYVFRYIFDASGALCAKYRENDTFIIQLRYCPLQNPCANRTRKREDCEAAAMLNRLDRFHGRV